MGFHDVLSFYNKAKYRELKDLRREESKLDRKIESENKKLEKAMARLNKK